MSSLACPINLDTGRLGAAVLETYTRVALDPGGDFHFNRGPAYAARQLGYDPAALAALPATSTERFAGVGNPLAAAPLSEGDSVVDVGCGAGLDLLLAATRVGPAGRVIGVDGCDAMIARCRSAAAAAGLGAVEVRKGDLHELPIEDASVDVAISNGVLNLAHDKPRAFSELHRVLAPGGRLQLADIVVAEALSESIRNNFELWAA
jgi:arsenite methyltransferase